MSGQSVAKLEQFVAIDVALIEQTDAWAPTSSPPPSKT